MKQFWLGIFLLLLFLGLGLWVTKAMEDTHSAVSEALTLAAEQAMAGDLESGVQTAEQARGKWQAGWHGTAAVADHAPMDEIDSLFAQMQVYAQAGEAVDFAAYCRRLSALVHAVGEAHGFSWWNLL